MTADGIQEGADHCAIIGIAGGWLSRGSFGMPAARRLCQCRPARRLTQGCVIDQQQIDSVPVGSSREQVLLALGSPSTTATFDNEVFYYISQKRYRGGRLRRSRS